MCVSPRPPWHCPRTVPAPEPGWQPGKAFWGKSIRNTISEDLRRSQKMSEGNAPSETEYVEI